MKNASILGLAVATTLFASAAGTPAHAWKDGIGWTPRPFASGNGAVSSIHPEPVMPRVNGFKGSFGSGGVTPRTIVDPHPRVTGLKGINSFKGFKGFKGFSR